MIINFLIIIQVEIEDFYSVSIKDAAMVVALTPERDVLLKKEYRYCYQKDLIELPAGCMEDGESPLETAKRELHEETGYGSNKWTYLGATIESSSKLTNYMHIFLAEECVKEDTQHLDAGEVVEVMKLPFSEALEMVEKNEIYCNSSIAGLLKAERLMKKREEHESF